ncbi:MAG: hypothetical protein KAU48_06815 [Candidatus Thorarchaeota archaeon]|nr:hypothetical protein [Candidatus Thorarchaeota archaeon]
MSDNCNDNRINTDEGIIVEASLDLLRKAAEKVLFEFDEVIYNSQGKEKSQEEKMVPGDSVLFEEDIKLCPAQVVVIKITVGLWYVISTSDIPQGGYPSGRDAMRAAQSEEKKLRIIKEFLMKEAGVEKVEDICEWKPDVRADAIDVLSIINKASRKWAH